MQLAMSSSSQEKSPELVGDAIEKHVGKYGFDLYIILQEIISKSLFNINNINM